MKKTIFLKKNRKRLSYFVEKQYLCSPKGKARKKNYYKHKPEKGTIKMTKAEIINNIANRTGISRADVSVVVEAAMEEVRNSLINKENVYLRGFGTFEVKHRAQKTARNISKNTTLIIEAHDIPGFKPSKSFVEKMK